MYRWRPVQKNSSRSHEYSASEEQLRQHSVASNVNTEAVLRLQAEALAKLGVTRYRQVAWTLKPCEDHLQDWHLQKALQRLGLHPKPWRHWKAVLRDSQIAWDFAYDGDGFLRKCSLWDAAGQWHRQLPWHRKQFRCVYYSDRTRGANVDWIPYLYVESVGDGYCCPCSREKGEGCPNCSKHYLLIPVTLIARHRICEHVMRLLALLQMPRSRYDSSAVYQLPLQLVGEIGSFLWREGAVDV